MLYAIGKFLFYLLTTYALMYELLYLFSLKTMIASNKKFLAVCERLTAASKKRQEIQAKIMDLLKEDLSDKSKDWSKITAKPEPGSAADSINKLRAELKSLKDSKEDGNILGGAIITKLPIIAWFFLGIFTFNWPLYLLLWFFTLVIPSPIGYWAKDYAEPIGSDIKGKVYMGAVWLDSLVDFCFCVLCIINAYHLHIDFAPIIGDWLKHIL